MSTVRVKGARTRAAAGIKLVCLDFDGTIMCYEPMPGLFDPAVITLLNQLETRGIAWCTNSGRDFDDQLRVLEASMRAGLRHKPVALLCSESVIYERRNGVYHGAEPWNARVFNELRAMHRQVQYVLDPQLDDLVQRYRKCPVFLGDHYTAFNVVDEDGLPVALFDELRRKLSAVQGCKVTRNGGWVAVITDGLGKGSILQEYARRAGLLAREILAVGDQFNDLDMLDGKPAKFVGCPANSIPEVVQSVRTAKGVVAESRGPQGTVEVIEYFLGL